jgi:histidinol phosphatase-like PHP family hydrolase
MTVDALLRQAESLNLSTIAITDHIFKPSDHDKIRQIRKEVEAYNPKLKVFVGAEVDVDYNHTDGRLVTNDFDELDYVIVGFHFVPTIGNYPRGADDNALAADVFMEYWQSTLLGIVGNPNIDTLAHPGRLLAAGADLDVYFDDGLAVLAKAAKLSAQNNIAWELNELTGLRLAGVWQEQWHRVYEVALAEGVKFIYGSDAHTPQMMNNQTFTNMLLDQLPIGCLSQPADIIRNF